VAYDTIDDLGPLEANGIHMLAGQSELLWELSKHSVVQLGAA